MTPVIPATWADIDYVVANLSDQNRAEQRAYGLDNSTLVERLATMLSRGESETAFIDGNPAYVFGVVDGFTWFIATEAYFSTGLVGIRYTRERLKAHRRASGAPLISLSKSPRGDAAKWFKLLGFEEKPMRSVDGERMFVYQ